MNRFAPPSKIFKAVGDGAKANREVEVEESREGPGIF